MLDLAPDFRYTLRSLRQAPVFTVVAVLLMAFGIGANTAVFTLVDQVLLRSLPVVRPSELVQVDARGTESYGGGMGDGTEISYPMYRDLRDNNEAFASMFCRFTTSLHVGYADHTERANGELVSGTFFPALGIRPALGRVFTADDDRKPGGHPLAVLGYRYWMGRFGGDPSVIGRTLSVNGHPLQVIGVVQAGFDGLDLGLPAQVYVPMAMEPQMGPSWLRLEDRRFRWVQAYARLRQGMTAPSAQVSLQPFYNSRLRAEADDAAFSSASAETKQRFLQGELTVESASRGHSSLRQSVEKPLLILMAIAGGVMLIVCANVANLLVARGLVRRRELALRLAIGATRSRVVRLLMIESLVISAVGSAIGLLLAVWGASVLLGYFATPESLLAITAQPDVRIVLFSGALALAAALAAGLLSALRVAGVDLAPTLKESSGGATGGRPRLQKALVVAQVSLSFLLLIGAGLFLRTLDNLMEVDPGFTTERMLVLSLDLSRSGYDADRSHALFKDLMQRISGTPGVSGVASTFVTLIEGGGWGMGFTVEGYQPKAGEGTGSLCNAVSPGFFSVMGMPVLAGREFDAHDDRVLPPPKGWPYRVAVVNQTFAERYFQGSNPIGRHIGIGEDPGTEMPIEIVGLVKDAHYKAVREDKTPQVFFPYLQMGGMENVTVYVRADGPPDAVMASIRKEVAGLDPGLALYDVTTLEERIDRSIVNERLIATLSATLSALATLLSVIGLYGVMAYTVGRRTREIGIRMALGALGSQIARSLLREAAVVVAGGLCIGFAAAWWLGRYLESQLYGVKPADSWTIAAAALALTTVAATAASIPARRAARVAPMSALRQE